MEEYNIEDTEDLITKFIEENICSDIAKRIEERLDNYAKVKVTLNIYSYSNILFINSIHVSFFKDSGMEINEYENEYEIYNNKVVGIKIDYNDIIDAIVSDYGFNRG